MAARFTTNNPIFAAWGGQPPTAIQSGSFGTQNAISAGSLPTHAGMPVLQGGPRQALQLPFTSVSSPSLPNSTALYGNDNTPRMI